MKPFSKAAQMYIKGLISWREYKERVKWTKKKKKDGELKNTKKQ